MTGIKDGRAGYSDSRQMKRHLDYVARNVPRYTSYPTAPHFSEEVDGAAYAAWQVLRLFEEIINYPLRAER